MNKIVERAIYTFGVSSSFYDVTSELNFLQNNLPEEFTNRDVLDMGCGDGKVSLKLKTILLPKSFKGIDASRSLVRSAQKRGIQASVLDVEREQITGDLGILWGVLHHFENPSETLKKLSGEFNSLIIRESVDNKRMLELGHRLSLDKLMTIMKEAQISPFKVVEMGENKSVILFVHAE